MTAINLGYLEVIDHYWKGFFRHVKNYSLLFHVHNEKEGIKASRKPILRKWITNAQHNLFASMRIRDFLEKNLVIEVPRADTLINPLTFDAPASPTPYPPLKEGRFLFVMLATLEVRRKAQDHLINVLSLAKWKEREWCLYLYGGGEDKQKLQALIEEKQLDGRVVLKGHTKNVKDALAEAHLLLQMTHIDAMPLAVIEAMSMAKPLAVSDVGDMPKWVIEDENGWISQNASEEKIDATLEKAWQNRQRWEERGTASFRLFQEKFPPIPEKYLLEQLSR
jgi:glycosyltransferase involved in cell wall biosynthesis